MKGLITNKNALKTAAMAARRPRPWRTARGEFAAALVRRGYGMTRAWATAAVLYRLDSIPEAELPRHMTLEALED